MKRIFLAVSFQDNTFIANYISEIQSKLTAQKIKWVAAKNLHITLKFFGPTPSEQIKHIENTLDQCLAGAKSISLSFTHLGLFGSNYRARVLWMAPGNPEPLQELEQKIRAALMEAGFAYDRQNFVPHLTIARIKKIDSRKYFQSVLDRYRDFDSGPVKIAQVYLYQSILHKNGPEYKVLKSWKLK
jgi:2'-5' RNA ligase